MTRAGMPQMAMTVGPAMQQDWNQPPARQTGTVGISKNREYNKAGTDSICSRDTGGLNRHRVPSVERNDKTNPTTA